MWRCAKSAAQSVHSHRRPPAPSPSGGQTCGPGALSVVPHLSL